MAARKNRGTLDKPWDDKVRAKIQTSMLVNRLTKFVNGKVKLDPPQVTAALGLLKKTLPDLQAVEHSGDKDKPITHTVSWAE
jgi:hypothetical protein